jgi:hypothetical protein
LTSPGDYHREYNSVLVLRQITVPYSDTFNRNDDGDGWYYGVSLSALVSLTVKHG